MCFTAGSLAVFGKLQEGEAEKKKQNFHSVLCLVDVIDADFSE